MRRTSVKSLLTLLCVSLVLVSCDNKSTSQATGWTYNDPANGYFKVVETIEQSIGPGLVAIEGGTFTMGSTIDNPYSEWNNIPRQVTVSSFYMDKYEVSNLDYLEYIHWLGRVYGQDYPDMVTKALPDTTVWRNSLSYNEPMVEIYFRHPSYRDYPVVGVNWLQANEYALWRSDRVNERLLVEAGAIEYNNNQNKDNFFTTDNYLAGKYNTNNSATINDSINIAADSVLSNKKNKGQSMTVKMEDGILLPKYRLPTEAEWEYAALGLIGNNNNEIIVERKVYPWNTNGLRIDDHTSYGGFNANFKRGKGDYMGVAGSLNDGAALPATVASYWPNDFGLYNMAGNVSEWVLDVYRPLSYEDFDDYNPYRGDTSIYNINYRDGDYASIIATDWTYDTTQKPENYTKMMYNYGETTLISDKSRVYKGGSWADGPYYLSPSVRRFMNEDESSSTVGFRCAMNKIGSALAR